MESSKNINVQSDKIAKLMEEKKKLDKKSEELARMIRKLVYAR
jgi:hypothetical protein